jgi:hypothetical protein
MSPVTTDALIDVPVGKPGDAGERLRTKPKANTMSKPQWTEADRSQGMAPGARSCVEPSSVTAAGLWFMRIRTAAGTACQERNWGVYN